MKDLIKSAKETEVVYIGLTGPAHHTGGKLIDVIDGSGASVWVSEEIEYDGRRFLKLIKPK